MTESRQNATAQVADITKAHYFQLDGLRGLAILLVMVYHFCLPYPGFQRPGAPLLLQAAQAGWMGVDLFFVLSGFLITGILIEARAHEHYLRNFIARRSLRIWPLYYVNLLALLVIVPHLLPAVPDELHSMQQKQVWFWSYLANWLFAREGGFNSTSGGYFWSLAVEEQFYLIWPFVVRYVSERGLLRIALTLLGISLLTRIVLASVGVSSGSLYTMTFTHMDGLAIGASLAVCMRSAALIERLRRIAPWAALTALGGLAICRLFDGNFFFWSGAVATYGYSLLAVAFGALLFFALRSDHSPLARMLATTFLRKAGKFSYALYMVHVPTASFLYPLTFRALEGSEGGGDQNVVFLVAFIASFAASWAAAVVSWHVFEKRILALKRYFPYQ